MSLGVILEWLARMDVWRRSQRTWTNVCSQAGQSLEWKELMRKVEYLPGSSMIFHSFARGWNRSEKEEEQGSLECRLCNLERMGAKRV